MDVAMVARSEKMGIFAGLGYSMQGEIEGKRSGKKKMFSSC